MWVHNPRFHSLSPIQYKNLPVCELIALFLPQYTGSSKTSRPLSYPLSWTTTCSNARSQAASSLSARHLCCTTTWSTITHRATQAPLAASRRAPQTNRTTARRPLAGAVPSHLPTVSAHFIYQYLLLLFVWVFVFVWVAGQVHWHFVHIYVCLLALALLTCPYNVHLQVHHLIFLGVC